MPNYISRYTICVPISLLTLVFLSMLPASGLNAENLRNRAEYHMKLASIAVEGTSWADAGHNIERYIEEKSGGRIRVTWYLGQIMGDEPDTLRKIRLGQIHGAAFTNVGLALIAPETRILSLPFLFHNYEETDYVINKLNPFFQRLFADRGFILTRWVEVGFNYWFFKKPVTSIEDFSHFRIWAWGGDPVTTEINQALGFQNVPLPLPEVLTALQTGMLQAFYGPTYATVSLQWFTQAEYFIDTPFSYTPAAILFDKKFLEGLPSDLQKVVLDASDAYIPELAKVIRKDNEKAYRGIIAHGVKPLQLKDDLVNALKAKTEKIGEKFSGDLYPPSLLTETQNILKEFRANPAQNR